MTPWDACQDDAFIACLISFMCNIHYICALINLLKMYFNVNLCSYFYFQDWKCSALWNKNLLFLLNGKFHYNPFCWTLLHLHVNTIYIFSLYNPPMLSWWKLKLYIFFERACHWYVKDWCAGFCWCYNLLQWSYVKFYFLTN